MRMDRMYTHCADIAFGSVRPPGLSVSGDNNNDRDVK